MAIVDVNTLLDCRPIPKYPGYWATRDGKILSHFQASNRLLPPTQLRQLTPGLAGWGYHYVSVRRVDGKRHCRGVHVLVLETFVGPREAHQQTMHLDNNPTNNRVENLRWGTATENNRHKAHFGTLPKGSRNGMAKLTEQDVLAIRAERAAGAKKADLAEKYGVCEFTIYLIYKRRIWRHI